MLFDEHCKIGKLQVDDNTIQVVAPFKKIVWSVPRAAVTRITQQPSGLAVDLTIHTTQGVYSAPYVPKRKMPTFLALFPGLEVATAGKEWYSDPIRLTYIATYTNEQEMQREVESAALNGWMPQNTAGTAGHVNVGRTAAKVALLGPLALIGGASRSKDKITITFVRTPEWAAQNR
jgi:hypothetical protein